MAAFGGQRLETPVGLSGIAGHAMSAAVGPAAYFEHTGGPADD